MPRLHLSQSTMRFSSHCVWAGTRKRPGRPCRCRQLGRRIPAESARRRGADPSGVAVSWSKHHSGQTPCLHDAPSRVAPDCKPGLRACCSVPNGSRPKPPSGGLDHLILSDVGGEPDAAEPEVAGQGPFSACLVEWAHEGSHPGPVAAHDAAVVVVTTVRGIARRRELRGGQNTRGSKS